METCFQVHVLQNTRCMKNFKQSADYHVLQTLDIQNKSRQVTQGAWKMPQIQFKLCTANNEIINNLNYLFE